MRAVVLAAGRGSRMGAATRDQPKCLTELAGKPLLRWQCDALTAAGAGDIALATGYRAGALAGWTRRVFHNPRWTETNMVMSLAAAAEWLRREPCLVSYSDIVYSAKAVEALVQAPADIAIAYDRLWRALWALRFEDPLEDAETFKLDAGGTLVEIGRRPRDYSEIHGQYMGLLKFTPAGWTAVEAALAALPAARRDRLDMTGLLNLLLERGCAVAACPVDGGWCEVDSEADLAAYRRALDAGGWSHDWRGTQAASEAGPW